MATKKFLLFFHDGTSIDRIIIQADTEQEARDAFAVSNPNDRVLKLFGPQEA